MGNKGIGAFIVGGLLGAGIALLYAPRTGVETRACVSEKMNTAWGDAQEFGAQANAKSQQFYQEAAARGQEICTDVAAKGQEVYSGAAARVQEAAETIKPVFFEKNDELREKIEAARQRIASQVVNNAESSAVAAEKIPVDAQDEAVESVEASADVPVEVAPDEIKAATEVKPAE